MSARYRIVHYAPDPILGSRVPIAALVASSRVGLSVVRAPFIPGPECLGGRAHAAVVQMVLEHLTRVASFAEAQAGAGPHITLDAERSVPDNAADPVEWVRLLLSADHRREAAPAQHQSPQRSTYGHRFFESYRVDSYVHSKFSSETEGGVFLPEAKVLRTITHYVSGRSDLLLMEPMLPARESLEDDISSVAELFAAYKQLAKNEGARLPRFVAYVLAGGPKSARALVADTLSRFADDVLDTEDPRVRGSFIQRIRDVGESAEPQIMH